MKEKILNYFRTDRSHQAGVTLIIEYSTRLHLKKQLNVHPASEYMTGVVHEELRQLAGISPDDLKGILADPVQKKSLPVQEPIIQPTSTLPDPPVDPPAGKKSVKTPAAAEEKKESRKK
jgi:hypothetical protein